MGLAVTESHGRKNLNQVTLPIAAAHLTRLLDGVDLALFPDGHDEGGGVAHIHRLELLLGQVSAPTVQERTGKFGVL